MMAITVTVPSRPIFLTVDGRPLYGRTPYTVRCEALLIPSQDGESCPRYHRGLLLKLWQRVSGQWGGRLLGDLYGLVPLYNGSVGGWGPGSVGIGSLGKEGSVGEVEIIPENVELESRVGW